MLRTVCAAGEHPVHHCPRQRVTIVTAMIDVDREIIGSLMRAHRTHQYWQAAVGGTGPVKEPLTSTWNLKAPYAERAKDRRLQIGGYGGVGAASEGVVKTPFQRVSLTVSR
jgi:hypothetical protein